MATTKLQTASAQLSLEDAKNLALKGGGVLLVLWGIGVIVLLLSPLAFPDWPSASFFSTSLVEETKPIDFLQLYIPANPFASLANGVVPAGYDTNSNLIKLEMRQRWASQLFGRSRARHDLLLLG